MRRRHLLGMALAAAAAAAGVVAHPGPAHALDSWTIETLEAFADTHIPGAKRFASDRAVAGAATGPGGAHAGFIALLTQPELGLTALLPGIAITLNGKALTYAASKGIYLSPLLPAFVALSYKHRTAVIDGLYQYDILERRLWSIMAFMVSLAFDCAAHLPTAQAATNHPGLGFIGFPPPNPDGLWRYPDYSYRRPLANPHPATTPEGNPE